MRNCGDRSVLGLAAGALTGVLVAAGGVLGPGVSPALAGATLGQVERDTIIFRDGKKVEGEIIEETDTSVKIRVMHAGLSATTTYDKANILLIDRSEGDAPAAEAPKAAKTDLTSKPKEPVAVRDGAARVYVVNLDGRFGRDISQTPIRDAVADAKSQNADYLIFVLDNDWSMALVGGFEDEELPDDANQFDELWRAEDMDPIFTEEIPREFEKEPTVIFWVKQAMGGAAFLPLNCPNIYFSSDARMGGIGDLSTLFGSTGDEVVRQKQYSLRLGHAKGMANRGGYDTKIVEAMTQYEKAFCYKMVGGKAVIYERMPESADEYLLADDGTQSPDTIEQLARGKGNDTLTLTASTARDLGVSKATVDNLDDLLYELGIERNHVIVSKRDGSDDPTSASDKIMEDWSEGIVRAERQMRSLWREYQQIQVGGEYRERQAARGRQIRTLEKIIRLIKQYGEAINPNQIGVPDQGQLEALIAQIRLQMLQDKK